MKTRDPAHDDRSVPAAASDPGSSPTPEPAPACPDCTPREMMAIAAGRFIKDGDILFAGTGVALLAAGCAKRVHAPGAVVFVETGGIDPSLEEIPLAVADPRVMHGTCINAGIIEAFSYISSPRLHSIAFLGAAQIDKYGNLNSTCIGDYERPTVRFSGSGGACDAASLASAYIVFMQHGRRKFVEKLDYLTSPGWLEGGDARHRAGFVRGGPLAVVTDLCVLKFDDDTHEMYLAERFPDVTDEQVLAETGFELDVSHAVDCAPPTAEELRILRDEVDPQRLILG